MLHLVRRYKYIFVYTSNLIDDISPYKNIDKYVLGYFLNKKFTLFLFYSLMNYKYSF